MRIIVPKNKSRKYPPLNITVRITGFVEDGNGQVGAQGINALTGQELTVWLTDKGKSAENKNRESLAQLRDGIKTGRSVRILEVGGLVSFKFAFPKSQNSNQFWSSWANVLAYNRAESDSSVIYSKFAYLGIYKYQDFFNDSIPYEKKQRPFGYFGLYSPNPSSHIVAPTPDQAAPAILAHCNNCAPLKPIFLFRFLDANNHVIGFSYIFNHNYYDKTKSRAMTSEEIANYCVAFANEQLQHYSSVSCINILPGKRYSISAQQLKPRIKEDSAVKFWVNIAEHFCTATHYEEYSVYEHCCKEVFGKIGGTEGQFLNGLQFVHPDKDTPGEDPVLLGGLAYSDSLEADKPEGREEDSEQNRPQESQQSSHESNISSVPGETLQGRDVVPDPVQEKSPVEADPFQSTASGQEEDPFAGLDTPPIPQEPTSQAGITDDGFGGQF